MMLNMPQVIGACDLSYVKAHIVAHDPRMRKLLVMYLASGYWTGFTILCEVNYKQKFNSSSYLPVVNLGWLCLYKTTASVDFCKWLFAI